MSGKVVGEGRQSSPSAVTDDMLTAVDDIFDLMLSSMFREGTGLEEDKEEVLSSLVGSFDDRVKAAESDIEAKGGEQFAPPAAIMQRNSFVALRSRAAERFRKETGKEWLPA